MNNRTVYFFKELSKIPRESGNESEVSNYICNFAEKRGLDYKQDKYGNVIIKKYNGNNEPIILQAHLDMVCEKDNVEFDFSKDSIEVHEEDGYLKAKGTTLGADNGVGVAQILNILDDDLMLNIEAVFTVSEETTMIGAENIDVSSLRGKKMINLDGFEEKTIITESASFWDIIMNLNYEKEENLDNFYKIEVNGMKGGHSGFEIDKGYGNSNIELANILLAIKDIKLATFCGGTKFNVIPKQAEAVFYSKIENDKIMELLKPLQELIEKKYDGASVSIDKIRETRDVISYEDSKRFLKSISTFKHGVYNRNEENIVTTSVNLGVVDLDHNIIKIGMRSSRKIEEKNALSELQSYADNNNYELIVLSSQPGFETKKDSLLVKRMCDAYNKVLGDNRLKIKTVHITVECGFFVNKIPDLEVIIISPKIVGAHSTSEKVELKSIEECDKWLYEFLEKYK